MVVVINDGSVIMGVFGPLTNDHSPVPTAGLIAAIVTAVSLHNVWSPPAAALGSSQTSIFMLSDLSQLEDPVV